MLIIYIYIYIHIHIYIYIYILFVHIHVLPFLVEALLPALAFTPFRPLPFPNLADTMW